MIRKITLILLLFIGFHGYVHAQTEDSVSIFLPWGSDTTCPGDQLRFVAIESNDTAVGSTYKWYVNTTFTGVTIDTFYTTAPVEGDSVYCWIYFINSLGFLDSARSNTIIVHRSSAVAPHVLNAITAGSNPDCPGHPITFTAYPGVGGSAPTYQWFVDNVAIFGATSYNFTDTFNDGDTVTVMMISNATCAFPTDTAYSNGIEVIHDSLTALLTMSVLHNPICAFSHDTFVTTVADAGLGSTIYWFVNGTLVPGVTGSPIYPTDSLHNGDIVYAMLVAPDACVVNDTTISPSVTMTVIPNLTPTVTLALTHGANPGCIDSAITYTATFLDGGTTPTIEWLVNDTVVASGSAVHTQAYDNGDLLTFRIIPTDGGCYSVDSVTTAAILMVRDSTPVAPLISLIDNMLVANTAGTYIWYFNGVIIPGANAQTYHPTSLGYYYAIRDTGNCQSLPSNTLYISLIQVKDVVAGQAKLFPNPTTGMLSLDWGNSRVSAKVVVYNVVGQAMMEQEIVNESHKDMDLSSLPNGNYILTIKGKDGEVSTHKVLLAK